MLLTVHSPWKWSRPKSRDTPVLHCYKYQNTVEGFAIVFFHGCCHHFHRHHHCLFFSFSQLCHEARSVVDVKVSHHTLSMSQEILIVCFR